MDTSVIYLDHAAATPLDKRAFEAMKPFFFESFYNPSAPYAPAIAVRRAYQVAKQTIAHSIGAKGDELVMTAGATESINLAFGSIDGHVVVSAIEHQSVLAAAMTRSHTIIPVDHFGMVSPDRLARALQPDTQLVSIALANNELGTIQPIRAIAGVIAKERDRRLSMDETTPIYLHVDASQGLGLLDVHVARLGVDMLTINAGKVGGPKQVGALWASRRVQLRPQIVGGGQERGLRSGTENVAGVIGFATALQYAIEHQHGEAKRLAELRDYLQSTLLTAFPKAVVSGSIKHRLCNFLHVSWPKLDGERLLMLLEMRGVLVATGSACAANKGTRSHVLEAIGLAPEVSDGSLRISLGRLSTKDNTEQAAKLIIEVVNQEYERIRQ